MTALQAQELVALMAELGLWCGFLGAMLYMFLRGCVIAAWAAVSRSEWYQDFEDRQYVRWLNSDTVRRIKAARQGGRIGLAVLLAVVVGLVVYLTACAAPEPRLTGSDEWYDKVVKGGW